MRLIINRHRRDETAEIDNASRVRWEYPDGRYVEVYMDMDGRLMAAAADSLAIEMHSTNRCILVPVVYDGRIMTDRLGYQEVSE